MALCTCCKSRGEYRYPENVIICGNCHGSGQEPKRGNLEIGPGQIWLNGPAVFTVQQLREAIMLAEALAKPGDESEHYVESR